MQIKKLLEIQSIMEDRAIPSDMFDNELVYHSESEQKTIPVLDMHLTHFVRAFNKLQDRILDLEREKDYSDSCLKQTQDYNYENFKKMFESIFNKGR